jgi:hypothetical protein
MNIFVGPFDISDICSKWRSNINNPYIEFNVKHKINDIISTILKFYKLLILATKIKISSLINLVIRLLTDIINKIKEFELFLHSNTYDAFHNLLQCFIILLEYTEISNKGEQSQHNKYDDLIEIYVGLEKKLDIKYDHTIASFKQILDDNIYGDVFNKIMLAIQNAKDQQLDISVDILSTNV